MVRTSIQLTEKQAEWLEKESDVTGLSKTDIVRRALDIEIEKSKVAKYKYPEMPCNGSQSKAGSE